VEYHPVFRIERERMLFLLHEEPEFAEGFLTHLLSRNIRMEEDLVDQLFNSSEKGLARLLLFAGEFWQGIQARAPHRENQ
jgi:CRP/FNR family cyclic AMP-dependent transcriptional regulator